MVGVIIAGAVLLNAKAMRAHRDPVERGKAREAMVKNFGGRLSVPASLNSVPLWQALPVSLTTVLVSVSETPKGVMHTMGV